MEAIQAEIREILGLSPIFNNWLSEQDQETLVQEFRDLYGDGWRVQPSITAH